MLCCLSDVSLAYEDETQHCVGQRYKPAYDELVYLLKIKNKNIAV